MKKLTIVSLIFIALMMIMSCDDDSANFYHYEWVFDTTDSLKIQDPEDVIGKHKFLWSMDGNGICPHRIKVTITGIYQTSQQIKKTFELPAKKTALKFRRLDRIKEQEKFIRDLQVYIEFFVKPQPESKYSKMMRNLELPLKRLYQSNADYRALYVFGDGLQNNPQTVNFYLFRANPTLLDTELVFDSLSTILLKDTPLPRLDDIEIKIIGLPRKKDDELAHYAHKFWQRFYDEAGALSIDRITNF